MDFLAEACESLVANAITGSLDTTILPSDVERWQDIFHFSATEAEREITNWRLDIGRKSVSAHGWRMVEQSYSKRGFDKEAYEYALASGRLGETIHRRNVVPTAAQRAGRFLLRLEGVMPTPAAAQAIGSLACPPPEYRGENEDGQQANFCIVDAAAKQSIERGILEQSLDFCPFFIRLPEATKDLSAICRWPSLGIDSTMPQHRLSDSHPPTPAQDEYPVWYFFYGTLADRDVLARVLNRDIAQADLREAYVNGGKLTTIGKYRAMIHADQRASVSGSAFLVRTREEEDALRYYETELYSVARCSIHMPTERSVVDGLTFVAAE
ncbi:hypothetical protein GGR57DRAFT_512024 [Xylariaceae sp. FL1272]|nr:hypothetical protein GGR57DRAFT_512024 [Xylariaceae sp. FL1272]